MLETVLTFPIFENVDIGTEEYLTDGRSNLKRSNFFWRKIIDRPEEDISDWTLRPKVAHFQELRFYLRIWFATKNILKHLPKKSSQWTELVTISDFDVPSVENEFECIWHV